MNKFKILFASFIALSLSLTSCDKDDDEPTPSKVVEKAIIEDNASDIFAYEIKDLASGVASQYSFAFDQDKKCSSAACILVFPTEAAAKKAYDDAMASGANYGKMQHVANKIDITLTSIFGGFTYQQIKMMYEGIDETNADYSKYLSMFDSKKVYKKKVLVDEADKYGFSIETVEAGVSCNLIFEIDKESKCSGADFELIFPTEEMAKAAYESALNSNAVYIGLKQEGKSLKMKLGIAFRNLPKSMLQTMYNSIDENNEVDISQYTSMFNIGNKVEKTIVENTAEKFVCLVSGVKTGIVATFDLAFDANDKCTSALITADFPSEEAAQDCLKEIEETGGGYKATVSGKKLSVDATSFIAQYSRVIIEAMYNEVNEKNLGKYLNMFFKSEEKSKVLI